MGRGEERVPAEQVQKAPHQVGEEGGELPSARRAGLLDHGLSEDNFGIGSYAERPLAVQNREWWRSKEDEHPRAEAQCGVNEPLSVAGFKS